MTLDWNIVQGSDAWHDKRARMIGSSECAALFGLQESYSSDQFALWNVKRGKISPLRVDDSPGTRVWYGRRMEPVIALMAAELFGWTVRAPGPYATDDIQPGMGASLDGVIEEPGKAERLLGFEGPGLLEIKRVEWLQFRRKWTEDEPPEQIVMQAQHGCACGNYKWGVVVPLVSEVGLVAYRYAARPRIAEMIRTRVNRFWADVADDKEPDPSYSLTSAEALRAMFPPREDLRCVYFENEDGVDVDAASFFLAQKSKGEWQKQYDEYRNRLIWKLKGAPFGETDNFFIDAKPNKHGVVSLKVREKLGY